MAETCYVGLGSNVGDRLEALKRAVRSLGSRPGVHVTRVSSVYETDPVGPPQPDFLNAVAEVVTALSPRELLDVLKAIEGELGRREGERWGPRTIDLDLLLYGTQASEELGLVVPHPHMAERGFVLAALAELAPDVRVPGQGVAAELLERVGAGGVRPFAGPEALR